METKREKKQSTPALVGAPTILTSPFPSGIFQFPQPAFLPFATSQIVKNNVTVPLLNPGFVPSIPQQLSAQPEPLLLVPNMTTSTSLLTTNIEPPSILQCNQQLMLNSSPMPLILKSPAPSLQINQVFQEQQISPQVIVLPVSTGTDKTAGTSNVGQYKQITTVLNSKTEAGEGIAAVTSSASSKPGRKRSRETRKSSARSSSPAHKKEASSDVTGKKGVSDVDIAQVISNLPAGWQIVGLTGLNVAGENSLSAVQINPSPSLLAGTKATNSSAETVDIFDKTSIKTEPKCTPDQPSLVCVNLNTSSQPVASETAFDTCSVDALTCSVKLDDLPCPQMVSIKTECVESEEEKISGSNTVEVNSSTPAEISTSVRKGENVDNTDKSEAISQTPVQSHLTSGDKNHQVSMPDVLPGIKESHIAQTDKWTVVGLTSLTPDTSSESDKQVNTALPVTSSVKGEAGSSPEPTASLPKTIILKIPICQSSISPTASSQAVTSSSHQAKTSDAAESNPVVSSTTHGGAVGKSESENMKPEDVKWTVIGVTESGLNTTSTESDKTSAPNLFVPCSSISSPAVQSLLLSSSPASHVKTSVCNVTSTVTSPGQLQLLPRVSSSQPSSPSKPRRGKKLKDTGSVVSDSDSASNKSEPIISTSQVQPAAQWKVVGVTPLGMIPPAPSSPLLSVPQLNPVAPVGSLPFLISAGSNPPLYNFNFNTIGNSAVLTQTVNSATLSPNPTPSLLSSCSSPLSSTSSSPFPVVSFGGNPASPALSLSVPPTVLSPGIQLLQNLTQQHCLSQLIQSQVAAYQSQMNNMMTMKDPNQWNIVGMFANNQVSLLNQTQGKSEVVTPKLPSSTSTTEIQNSGQSSSVAPVKLETDEKEMSDFENGTDSAESTTTQDTALWQPSSSRSRRKSKLLNKVQRLRAAQKCKRKHEPEKAKKNTVSNLLKMKRMQENSRECLSQNSISLSLQNTQGIRSQMPSELPQRAMKRSLRSYAGNRKVFTKPRGRELNEKISLRSGTQIPVATYQSEDDDTKGRVAASDSQEEDKHSKDVCEIQNGNDHELAKNPPLKQEPCSAARKRKLKVPRRMVADLDYHPYDSSSDSN